MFEFNIRFRNSKYVDMLQLCDYMVLNQDLVLMLLACSHVSFYWTHTCIGILLEMVSFVDTDSLYLQKTLTSNLRFCQLLCL